MTCTNPVSKQHASQSVRILETIDPRKNLRSLFRKGLVWDIFQKHTATKYIADTIRCWETYSALRNTTSLTLNIVMETLIACIFKEIRNV